MAYDSKPAFYTILQASKALAMSVRRLRGHIAAGTVVTVMNGGHEEIPGHELHRLIDGGMVPPPRPKKKRK